MAEGGGEKSSSRVATSYEAVGGRQRFTVELRPGETTIISWKKLLKDATTSSSSKLDNGPSPAHPATLPPPPASLPSLDARLAPGQILENESRKAPPSRRLGTVIERIEGLHVGKVSSDEDDLNNDVVPADDEYDTEDSFIDDAELDEYFKVDNAVIKHEGFFVNRGKLEHIEPNLSPRQQPKKRKRKELAKDHSGDVRLNPNKHLKEKDIDQKMIVVLPSKNHGSKLKEGSEFSDTSNEKSNIKSSYAQGKLLSGRSFNNVDELNASIQRREEGGFPGKPETSVPDGKNSLQNARKEGSSARPRSTTLEKAIKDLEKLVSESRPPAMEAQDADNNTSQAVKRRLPPEIKQKLSKVARIAQESQGKITKELLNRLMSIVGHMIQLRSLKRNLKTMASVGLSVKEEKDNQVQHIKKEVAEMVRTRIPLMKCKALDPLSGTSDDFQENNTEEKEAFKRKYSMDDALEDIICDLYDLYVEGLEEDAGPQVRKLYAELAALWPSGFMDNHGIKHAICRAKDRRRVLQSRHKKIKKQVLVPKTQETPCFEAYDLAQPLYAPNNLVPATSDHGLTLANKSSSSSAAASAAVGTPISITNGPNTGRLKQEKVKGSASNSVT